MTRPALVPIATIVDLLRDRCDALVRELLPLGHRDGHEWREARRCQGGLGDSLSVRLSGERRGVWAVHGGSPDESGDLLDLVAYVKCAGIKKDAIAWAKAWLGIETADALARAQQRAPAPVDEKANEKAASEAEQRRRAAHRIYLEGQPLLGSPAHRYLIGRGLPIERLGFPLNALRFHPALWDRHTRRTWPGMVAAITGASGRFFAVHQTFLEVRGDGQVRKAPIVDAGGRPAAKRILGSYRGGMIRLWRGVVIDPDTGEIKQAPRLATARAPVTIDVTEGIENGLTVALADPAARVLACGSVSNLANVPLPATVTRLVLWRDGDASDSKAAAAFERAVAHFLAQGREVIECAAPRGFKDVNDMVQYADAIDANGVRGEMA